MKRLDMKDQRELLMAVGGLLANAEDPKFVQTNTAFVGTKNLAKVGRVWKRVWKKVHAK
jgi:hypothetical protein